MPNSPKRLLKDWIEEYVRYTANSESPSSYHKWAAIATVASSLQRKVRLTWGHTTLYPNQYIVIVGPSGRARKGEPITIAWKMVSHLGIPMVGEDNTRESVIRDVRNSATNYQDATSEKIVFQCAVTCFIEELAVFTGYQNTDFLATLTNWYDSRESWKRSTKHQGIDEIDGVCFNLLAATAPDWLSHILPREAVGGGFTSRVVFVVEERKGKVIPDPTLFPINKELENDLMYDLEIMQTLSGEYQITDDAKKFYVDWYLEQEALLEENKHPLSDPFLDGYISRRPTLLKKLSIVMAASRNNDMVIELQDIKKALKELETIEPNMWKVFKGMGTARNISATEAIADYIQNNKSATKAELLRVFMRLVDSRSLDEVMSTLSGMGGIVSERSESGEWTYKAKGRIIH